MQVKLAALTLMIMPIGVLVFSSLAILAGTLVLLRRAMTTGEER